MGIFSKLLDGKGRPTAKEYVLQIRDRVEIYRPLTIDPMQARLNRAETAKKKAAKHKAEQHPQTK
jgi:putative ubiquitin-RnfH superfamily antitoxin RatB of RatAB toxin-antitoxin module